MLTAFFIADKASPSYNESIKFAAASVSVSEINLYPFSNKSFLYLYNFL
ncbi:hypothetical protein BPP43_01870 [Brachyspira pilosicoli P43/6/78]|uniref:Uncharacterized protein n=1 Tax=Brachyspira pilosicoli P43/6/78 TaxID=1042417 RepID=A0A3B6VPL1_BRAPL|nr:hypothetical protein BPP43_01870 [Brachyspira pilosicoli P43/6/78]